MDFFYRPPDAGSSPIYCLRKEWEKLHIDYIGSYIVGDFNVHNKNWLHFSHSNTSEGALLYEFCRAHALTQTVREPTRGKYLLDLCLTDMPGTTKTKVETYIADHKVLWIAMHLPCPTPVEITRKVWIFSKAKWKNLQDELVNI